MNSNGEPATKAPPSGTHRKRRVNLLKAFLSCGVYATVLILAVGVSGKLPFLIVLLPLMFVADRVMDRLCHVKPELMQLTRIPTAALPRRTQEYFEMHTPEFVQVGFRLLGDFRVKPKTAQFSRFFVNDDGTTFGEISSVPTIGTSIHSCSVFSVTDGLVYIEVGNLRLPKDRPHPEFVLKGIPGANVVELLHHRDLAVAERATPDSEIAFQDDELPMVCVYGQKKLYESLIAEGVAKRNPYRDVRLEHSPALLQN